MRASNRQAADHKARGVPDRAWWELRPGDEVRIVQKDGAVFTGTVDTMTDDIDAVWVYEHGHGRRMLHPGDGHAVSRLGAS